MEDDQAISEGAKYFNLGCHSFKISTHSASAQIWFDRGIIWCYGFNHEEAMFCFQQAALHDDTCAMAHWGIAYSLGPNYNKPWDSFETRELKDTVERTHEAAADARLRAAGATALEQTLIDALQFRYPQARPDPTPGGFSIWNKAYADAMSSAYRQFPDHHDVAALYADALMNLTPWKLWDIKTGQPALGARTVEVQEVLSHALSQEGGLQHPGLLHLYIHMSEMSPCPEAALPIARHLRGLVPDAGHLQHMPSHLDILCGQYGNAIVANTDAIAADEKFLALRGNTNFYTLYRAHDYHFRIYAALLSGQSRVALDTVTRLESSITEELLRVETPPMADYLEAFLAVRYHVLVRFGLWEEVLHSKPPDDKDLYCTTTAIRHYARVISLAATGMIDQAEEEREQFSAAVQRVLPSRTLFNNTSLDILAIASAMLDGELEYRRSNYVEAYSHLRLAVARDDNLPYDEPWGWMQPARHALGALLLEQGHVDEAMRVYAADLGLDQTLPRQLQHPGNVWALHGYWECVKRKNREMDEGWVWEKLQVAMAKADVAVRASCFCRLRCERC